MTTAVGRSVPDGLAGAEAPEPDTRLGPTGGIPSAQTRKAKWNAFDARYNEWIGRNLPPAFVCQTGAHTWRIQYLIRPTPPRRGWLYRALFDPPYIGNAEPFYNGWPGDHRGWLSFETKECARDFYKLANRFIDFAAYRNLPDTCEPFAGRGHQIDLDEQGNFASEMEARRGETEGLDGSAATARPDAPPNQPTQHGDEG